MIKIDSIARGLCYCVLSRAYQAPKASRVRHSAWKPAANADDGDNVTTSSSLRVTHAITAVCLGPWSIGANVADRSARRASRCESM
jgi:hypothetical protein